MGKKLTTEEFICKAQEIHKDGNGEPLYDYSETVYVRSNQKVKIICRKHGVFDQTPHSHLSGSGCFNCSRIERGTSRRFTNNDFIQKANIIHNNRYDYSITQDINSRNKVDIICPKHGKFVQLANDHLSGSGCPKCKGENTSRISLCSIEDFIKKAQLIHGDIYDYSKSKYTGSKEKIKIYCKICHKYFFQTPNTHLTRNGCPYCSSSYMEKIVSQYLSKSKIDFKHNYHRDMILSINNIPLRFDFAILNKDIRIECQGRQHYQIIFFFHREEKSFMESFYRDNLKRKFCKDNGIKLIEIPYWEKNNIENILKREQVI